MVFGRRLVFDFRVGGIAVVVEASACLISSDVMGLLPSSIDSEDFGGIKGTVANPANGLSVVDFTAVSLGRGFTVGSLGNSPANFSNV